MKLSFVRIFILSAVVLSFTSLNAKSTNGLPWDAVLIDVSGDIMYLDNEGTSVGDMIYPTMQSLSQSSSPATVFMPYADARTMLSASDINKLSKEQLFDLSLTLGETTSTLNAIASLLNLPQKINRVLVLTNDKENNNGFTPSTLANILGSKGVTVDALIFNLKADSLRLPHYNLRFQNNPETGKVAELSALTGGKSAALHPGDNTSNSISNLIKIIRSGKRTKTLQETPYDNKVLEKVLSGLKPECIKVSKVDTATVVMYNGYIYHGLNEINRAQRDGSGKSGFVGKIEERYPVFDSEDYANENRYFSNYIFATSADELRAKTDAVKRLNGDMNFCKLTEDTPLHLLPMIYYKGEGDSMSICGLEVIYDDYTPEP